MSEDAEPEEEEPPKKSKLPLIIGLVLALAGGGGGFYATWSGMILGADSEHSDSEEAIEGETKIDVAYVPVDPLVISLQAPAQAQYLRFRASLEVPTENQEEIERLMPRVVDVLNSYLRALEPADLEHPAILTRIRAQMLRRVQVIAGLQKVNDLLIMEFVLN